MRPADHARQWVYEIICDVVLIQVAAVQMCPVQGRVGGEQMCQVCIGIHISGSVLGGTCDICDRLFVEGVFLQRLLNWNRLFGPNVTCKLT